GVAPRVAEDAAAQAQRLGVWLERERAVQGEEGAIAVPELPGGDPERVPHERQVRIGIGRAPQRRQRLGDPLQLNERRAYQREREAGRAELGEGAGGELQRIVAPTTAA